LFYSFLPLRNGKRRGESEEKRGGKKEAQTTAQE
jgi:hypothetical protein